MPVTILPGKAPFHHGLFFSAVRHHLGEPTAKSDMGDSGFYDYFWEMTPEIKQTIRDRWLMRAIRDWMRCFDMEWPESRCDIGKWRNSPNAETEYFRITVSLKVIEEKS
jgi:hypothetical protein